MIDELRVAIEAAGNRRYADIASSVDDFLAKYGPALIAAVELAEAAVSDYGAFADQFAWVNFEEALDAYRAAKEKQDAK